MTPTVSDLRDLKLTENEWSTLHTLRSDCYDQSLVGELMRADVDMLVLSGLCRRLSVWNPDTGKRVRWTDQWELTPEGVDAANAIDMIFDWDSFTFSELSSKKIKKD